MTDSALHASPTRPSFAFLERGFRPFFLLAGVYAALAIVVWLGIVQGWIAYGGAWPPAALHVHEMVFGFAAAAIAGFLLTAVPTWTGAGPVGGWRLAGLVMLWLAGRIAALAGADPTVFAAIDTPFIPALAALIGPGIVARSFKRNGAVLGLLALLFAANAATHLAALGLPRVSARWGNEVGLGVLVMLIAVIGGRIVPAFTLGGLRAKGKTVEIAPAPWLERAALGATAAWLLALTLELPDTAIGAAAGLAALGNLARMARWHTLATLGIPLVWVLHLGFAWLVAGLALAAGAWLAEAWPKIAALHALGAGAAATMILAVMTRASLGHTGRRLEAGRATAAAYLLVTIGALGRVVAGFLSGDLVVVLVGAAGAAWALGFLVFAAVYAPILLRPRSDGRPG